jgi:ERCC4-type nuclease
MKIYIDERERHLINYLENKTPLVKTVLPLGDIVLKTDDDAAEVVIIERKSIADLLSSIKDGRYAEQSHRLIHSSGLPTHRIVYLIEGMFQGQTVQEKQRVYSAIVSLNQIKGFSVFRTWSTEETGDVLLNMADKLQREMTKGKFSLNRVNETTVALENTIEGVSNGITKPNDTIVIDEYCKVVKKIKKDNITPENMGEIMLCQIPGISSVNAIQLMKRFSTIANLIESVKADPQCLSQHTFEIGGKTKKFNKNIVEAIQKYLVG